MNNSEESKEKVNQGSKEQKIQQIEVRKKQEKIAWKDLKDSDEEEDQWFDEESDKPINPILKTQSQKKPEIHEDKNTKPQQSKPFRKRNFLRDEEIIAKIESKQIPVDNIIKVVRCFSPELIQMLSKVKKRSMHEYKEGYFILYFETKQDLMSFIKEKIQKRYKFFLQPYVRREKQGFRETNRRGREEYKTNYESKDSAYREKVPIKYIQRQPQRKYTQKKEPVQSFQIIDKTIILHSEDFNEEIVLEQIHRKKLISYYKKMIIMSPVDIIHKAYVLSAAIFKRFNFGLEEDTQSSQKGIQQLVLSEGASGAKVLAIASKFASLGIESVSTLLGQSKANYFISIAKINKNILTEGFLLGDYVILFKEHLKKIFSYWKIWFIKAEGKLIEELLRLSHQISKSCQVTIHFNIGMQINKPFVTLQIQSKSQYNKFN